MTKGISHLWRVWRLEASHTDSDPAPTETLKTKDSGELPWLTASHIVAGGR